MVGNTGQVSQPQIISLPFERHAGGFVSATRNYNMKITMNLYMFPFVRPHFVKPQLYLFPQTHKTTKLVVELSKNYQRTLSPIKLTGGNSKS